MDIMGVRLSYGFKITAYAVICVSVFAVFTLVSSSTLHGKEWRLNKVNSATTGSGAAGHCLISACIHIWVEVGGDYRLDYFRLSAPPPCSPSTTTSPRSFFCAPSVRLVGLLLGCAHARGSAESMQLLEGVAVKAPTPSSRSLSLPLSLPPRLLLRPPRHRLLTKDAARRSEGAQTPILESKICPSS